MFLGTNVPQCSAINMLHYCAFVLIAVSHDPISYENRRLFKIKPTQTGHQIKILGMISVGFQRRVKNETNEPRREVKSEERVNVPVPYLNCLISQRMICWLRLTLHPVLRKTE